MCRVLANRTRLKMLALVWRNPGQTLSVLARSVNVTVSAGSQYVRRLESQELLTTRRRARWVECRPANPAKGEPIYGLLTALRTRVEGEKKAVEAVFKLVTAFTHARRVEIYRAVHEDGQTLAQLRRATGISRRPLLRHLQKLRSRNFLGVSGDRRKRYVALRHGDSFGRALGELVMGG
jgi:predicted transcriptional regulator